ncbi:MAG: tetratricopeptide repeat protein, partial [Desulfobacterota bacterium]|nr:tetratricopeptide repeat protein [Thermodesulfobacteriota bacterium]
LKNSDKPIDILKFFCDNNILLFFGRKIKLKLLSFLRKKKKGEKTLREYLKIAAKEPDNPGIQIKIGDLYLKKGKKPEALKSYLIAAEIYRKEELHQLAMSIYKTILSLDPTLVEVYFTLAHLYQNLGFIGDAVATYEKLVSHLMQEGRIIETSEVIKKMVMLDPSNPSIRQKADKYLQQLKENYNFEINSNRGGVKISFEQGISGNIEITLPEEKSGEKNYFDLGKELDDGEELLVSLETAKIKQDDSSMEVDKVFERIIKEIDGKTKEEASRLYYELGIAYQQMDRIDEAIEAFKKALDNQDIKNDCFRRLATCFRKKGMLDYAINAAKSGLRSRFISQKEYLNLNYELGLSYSEIGEIQKSIEIFQEIQKISPGFKDTDKILQNLSKGQNNGGV